jgi:hypothetical protein
MSCFAFLSLLFYWLLDFTPAPMLPLASCLKFFTRFPGLQLVLVAFLVVQSLHIHPLDGRFDLTACLKFQMVWYVS